MPSGYGIGAFANGFATGALTGAKLLALSSDREDKQRNYQLKKRTLNLAEKKVGIAQDTFDLTKELNDIKIKAAKSKLFNTQATTVSKLMRASMAGSDGNLLDQKTFETLPPAERIQRIDTINSGATWFANHGGFLKNYFASNPSIDPKTPVAGFQLMQSAQGDLGVLAHLNKKDGTTGGLDFPNRKDGQSTIIPADAFNGALWNLTGVFAGDKLSERGKLNLQNKNAVGLENLKHQNRVSEAGSTASHKDTRTPLRKNMEYLQQIGVAKTPGEALKIAQRAKTNPTKLVADMVKSTEENQLLFNIRQGDKRYKTRAQIIADTMGLIDQITGQQSTPQPAPQHPRDQAASPQGALPPQAAAQLQEGANTTFANGQIWTLRNGQSVRVK